MKFTKYENETINLLVRRKQSHPKEQGQTSGIGQHNNRLLKRANLHKYGVHDTRKPHDSRRLTFTVLRPIGLDHSDL